MRFARLLSFVSVNVFLFCNSYAIKGSPNQKLLLEDIYYAIESRVRRMSLPEAAAHIPPVSVFQDGAQRLEGEVTSDLSLHWAHIISAELCPP